MINQAEASMWLCMASLLTNARVERYRAIRLEASELNRHNHTRHCAYFTQQGDLEHHGIAIKSIHPRTAWLGEHGVCAGRQTGKADNL